MIDIENYGALLDEVSAQMFADAEQMEFCGGNWAVAEERAVKNGRIADFDPLPRRVPLEALDE